MQQHALAAILGLARRLGGGESVEFAFSAAPGEQLTFESMFVQSNDWFYAFDGLSLFDGDQPISGDVTSEVELYDAGTEADTAPGTGPDQKPVQDPEAMDVGPKEDEPIQLATERHPDFEVPVERLATWLARLDDEDE